MALDAFACQLFFSLRKLARRKKAKDGVARAGQILAVLNESVFSGETVDAHQLSAK